MILKFSKDVEPKIHLEKDSYELNNSPEQGCQQMSIFFTFPSFNLFIQSSLLNFFIILGHIP